MSRLDQHIGAVRRKMALGVFVVSLGWAALVVASAVLLGVLVYKFIGFRVPPLSIFVGAGLGVIASLAWAIYRRPSARHAAVEIDQKLNLFEKFSTALYVQSATDPFSQAAVRDAELSAEKLNLAGKFGLELPRAGFWAIPIAVAAFLAMFLPLFDLFGHRESAKNRETQMARVEAVRKIVKDNLAQVDMDAKRWGDTDELKRIHNALEQLVTKPITDVDKAQVTAAQAMQDLNKAMQDEAKRVKENAQAQEEARKSFEVPTPGPEDIGPVADAHRDLAKGDMDKALAKLENVADKFDKMDQKEQEKATEQMANLARELKKMAEDPAKQEETKKALQQQLQAMGQDQEQAKQQAQQMQKLMQQAAAGNKDAAQQVQQMANKAAQQMNGGQGPNAQQQQAIQKLQQQVAKAQAGANAQAQAGQMAGAAQGMAQAMKQGGQPQAGGQQAAGGQQQAGGQQAGAQAGQMAQGKQAMQQAMQNAVGQMQAAKQDAADIANAQQQAQAAANQAAGQIAAGQGGEGQQGKGGQGQGGEGKDGQGGQGQGRQAQANGQGKGNGGQGGQGQWQAGDPAQGGNGGGQGGPGVGAGGNTGKTDAPFDTIHANSPTLNDPNGKVIASSLIRDGKFLTGQNTAKIREVAAAGQRDQTEDVDDSRVDRKSAELTKEYFRTMEAEANKK